MTLLMAGPGRPDLRRTWQRDLDRHLRREEGDKSFWRSLRVLGGVGWPIVLAAAAGAMLGHRLDERWGTGVRSTLVLITLGVVLGALVAYHTIRGTRR
jgi:predicted F0F1-ATPase subunit